MGNHQDFKKITIHWCSNAKNMLMIIIIIIIIII